jgi:competence protein ComEC
VRAVHPLLVLAASMLLGAYGAIHAPLVLVLALWMWLGPYARDASGRHRTLLLAVAGIFALTMTLRVAATLRSEPVAFDTPGPRRCTGVGRVSSSPRKLSDAVWQLTVHVPALECNEATLARATSVRLYTDAAADLARDDTVEFYADLAPFERFANGDDVRIALARHDAALSGTAQGVRRVQDGRSLPSWIDRARSACRLRIEQTFPERSRGLARALVLGDTLEDRAQNETFQRSGLSHLLAVSGAHLVLVVLGLLRALRFILLRTTRLAAVLDLRRVCALVGIPLCFLYADFAGGSGSAQRAAWMTAGSLLCLALCRKLPVLRGLAISCVAMLACEPVAAFDISFLLSLAATAGLVLLAPRLAIARLPSWLRAPIANSAACSLTCAPILASLGSPQPLLGVAINVVAVPVGEWFCLPLSLLHSAAHPVPMLQGALARASDASLALLAQIAAMGARSGGYELPVFSTVELAVLAAMCIGPLAAQLRIGVGLLALTICELDARRAPHELVITHLDVGQGDATLVQFPSGQTLLIDAGGMVGGAIDVGKRVIQPVLRAKRIRALDVVVISHPHPDHFGGLIHGLDGVQVGEVWYSGQRDDNPFMGGLEQWLSGRTIVTGAALCGSHAFGAALITVLAPCPRPEPEHGANDNSIVMSLRFGVRTFLFVGDAEAYEEQQLLAQAEGTNALRADVLKVGHHGSRTSSSAAFVAAVAPSVAVVSSGVRNRFNHPHPNTVRTFADATIPLWRIDTLGAIQWRSDGQSLTASARGHCFGGVVPCSLRLRY